MRDSELSALRLRYALVAAALAALLVGTLMPGANRALFHGINDWGMHAPRLWAGLTVLGDTLTALAILLPFAVRRLDVVWLALMTVLVTSPVVRGLKLAFDLPRPYAVLPPEQFMVIGNPLSSLSFPSGHSATVFALAGVLVLGLQLRGLAFALVLGLAMLAALSRSAVGAHWPMDIAAGALIGWGGAALGAWLAARWAVRPHPYLQRGFFGVLLGCTLWLPFHASGYPPGYWMQYLVALGALGMSVLLLWGRKPPLSGAP